MAAKRPDGYHDLETIFYPIPLRDALEITTHRGKKDSAPFDLTVTGTDIPGDPASNLCRKAWELIKTDYPDVPAVKMHLHKAIPMGAGLGGGSSDGAFALIALNKELQLGISESKLAEYALQLGSDCPFFILNKPCYAIGRGEIMEPLTLDLGAFYFVVVNPGIHLDTGEAFRALQGFAKGGPSLKELVSQPVQTWKDNLVNDFEKGVFAKHPEIEEIKQMLYEAGAEYASMTGTGSSVYGIFPKSKKAENLKTSANFSVFILNQEH